MKSTFAVVALIMAGMILKVVSLDNQTTSCGHGTTRLCLAQDVNTTNNETLLPEPNSVTEMRGGWLLAYTSLALMRMVI